MKTGAKVNAMKYFITLFRIFKFCISGGNGAGPLTKASTKAEVLQLHAPSEGSLYQNADVCDLACDDCKGSSWVKISFPSTSPLSTD